MRALFVCLPLALVLSLAVWLPVSAGDQPMLAYVENGELWVKALPAGQPQRLTGRVDASQPRWSNDGQWLTYSSHGQLWVIRRSGDDEFHLNGHDVVVSDSWSPTSDLLIFSGPSELAQAAPVQKGNATNWEYSLSLPFGSQPTWSPDGQCVAFVVTNRPAIGAASLPSTRLLGYDPQNGMQVLFDPGRPASYAISPVGWPNPRQFLFRFNPNFSASLPVDGMALQLLDTSSHAVQEISRPVLGYPDFVSISPDGHQLAIAQGAGRDTWSNKRIALVNLDSGPNVTLTDPGIAAVSPAWSPDGQYIAFVAGPEASAEGGGASVFAALSQRHLWLMRADGTMKRQITADAGYRDELPRWSADGTFLTFARLDSKGHASVWQVDLATGRTSALVPNLKPAPDPMGDYGHIDWNRYFAFWPGPPMQVNNAQDNSLAVLSIGGSGLILIGGLMSWAVRLWQRRSSRDFI